MTVRTGAPDGVVAGYPSLHARVALLTGATSWTLHPFPERDLRALVVSDGPVGVRGVNEDIRPSAQLPNPSAVAATWDVELVRRLGALVAGEAHRKGVDVVLAPVVNLQRTPYGGRHFETFSEDPLLTGTIAAELVRSTQSCGVALCVKHFIGNESETDRTTYLARIPERALREVYLAPFERTVEAGVWSVMAAYNRVEAGSEANPATEHSHLINGILKGEWGFDGVVVSDWLATGSTVESALAGLDLVMPGPDGPWGTALEAAVADGNVAEAVVDDKVERIVRLGSRVGAVGTLRQPPVIDDDLPHRSSTRALLREAVTRSIVVLRNDDLLPLSSDRLRTVALIGPNALEPFVQGGGSAFVTAPYLAGPEAALRDALPDTRIIVSRGASGHEHAGPIDPHLVTASDGAPGYRITFLDAAGNVVDAERSVPADEEWNRDAPPEATQARIRAIVTLDRPGRHRIEVGVSGAHRIRFDEQTVSESRQWADHDVILDSSANNPSGPSAVFVAEGNEQVVVESDQQVVDAGAYGRFVRFALRHDFEEHTADEEIDQAVAAAAAADTAIVVVGTNEETESEGWDRQTLALPGRQNELVERVIAANPRTVVVVNAGAPVVLPWLERAAAVLWWWLPGQEAGTGLVDALLGVTEPSGRLPWTLPAIEADPRTAPIGGTIDYTEGIHIGYRGWDRDGRTPAREFGFGLGYGDWVYDELELRGDVDDLVVQVRLTNVSGRPSREVVQVYLEAPDSSIERPARWLAGFAIIDVPAGAADTALVPVDRRALEIWNVEAHRWEIPGGRYVFTAGRSSRDLRLSVPVSVQNQRLIRP
ncbi:beta-glucosidase [Kribbella sp. NPDC055071]